MLKHGDSLEPPPQAAAQVRVTPEELAAAITRLEARQGGLEGTIPLGDAVQELGLSATPEELLREIEAGRVRSQENHSQKPVPLSNRLRVSVVCALALLLSGGMVYSLRTSAPSPPVADSPAIMSVSVPQAAPKPILVDPDLMVQDASGKLVMLSEVGDNQPVGCRYFDGRFLQASPQDNYESWELIKHDGQVYVRGRIPKMSPKVFFSEGADVTTVRGDPAFAVPITMPVKGFNVVPGAGGYDEFHAVNIHLDKYAHEKWQP